MNVPVEMEEPRKVIGYWMSEKKSQKLNWKEFGNVCREHGFKLVKIDLARPLEEQGPFSVIIHKLTDVIAKAVQGDSNAREVIRQLEIYLECHPEVGVIDPLQNVRKLLERHHTYSIVNMNGQGNSGIFIPNFVELTSMDLEKNLQKLREAGVTFPFVCKPSIAHGSKNAHKMAIIFNEAGVKDCFPPCVAQSFVSHNAVLYKIFFVGDEYQIVERPSLKNFYPSDQETIFFDSHEVSRADSTSSLSILDPDDLQRLFEGNSVKLPMDDISSLPSPHPLLTPCPPDSTCIKALRKVLRKTLGMKLLGADLVWELGTGRYGIIDINVYPGYDGYPNFFESLMRCILRTIEEKNSEMLVQQNLDIAENIIMNSSRNDVCKPTHVRKHGAAFLRDKEVNGEVNGDDSGYLKEEMEVIDSGNEGQGVSDLAKGGTVFGNAVKDLPLGGDVKRGGDYRRSEGHEVDDSGCDTGDSSDEKKKKELMFNSAQSFLKEFSDGIERS